MKWDMEIEEIEAVLEKIWDLHDKLSDAIHTISRTHFLDSIKTLKKSDKKKPYGDAGDDNRAGFVFVKGFRVDDVDSAIQEAKSLNSIRTALENLEDQLEFFHAFWQVIGSKIEGIKKHSGMSYAPKLKAPKMCLEVITGNASVKFVLSVMDFERDVWQKKIHVTNACFTGVAVIDAWRTIQMQQRAERDTAIARLEQSRIVLAMRLAEHHGKKYKVIEEALAFVGDVHDASCFISPENLYSSPASGENNVTSGGQANGLIKVLISSFNFAKNSLKLDHMGGILGNAAMVAVSMIALLHLQQVSYKEHPQNQEDKVYINRIVRKTPELEGSSSNGRSNHLDVFLARG
ncbi:hypothetical protein JRO89_XS11G0213100 [Xanthoceras sorbifolium]|uniref:Plastid division protein PDV1 n=1 Tax=Xanthoceras sorbifolium TaxID=99658 RepID=A0ABQ8HGL3_9ROSI|nr:hypothetical protein JRO89_XS11G0213100 [Xanthoceras sorbifolium]